MDEIYFSERRNLSGDVRVAIHYPGARVDLSRIPTRYRQVFTEDVIGFYTLSRNVMPAPNYCFRMVHGYIAKEYQHDYIVDQFFLDALYRVITLDYERGNACLAIYTKKIKKNKQRKDFRWSKTNGELSRLWKMFKLRHRDSSLINFWVTKVRSTKEKRKLRKSEFGFFNEAVYLYDYAQIKIPVSQIGLPLTSFVEELAPVAETINKDPIQDVSSPELRVIAKGWGKLEDFDTPQAFLENISPLRFKDFSFDELSKIYYSIYAYSRMSKAYEGDRSGSDKYPTPAPDYDLVTKLKIALRQNSKYSEGEDWNTLVAAFEAIPTFDFGAGFEAYIDWTRSWNPIGRTKYTRHYNSKGKITDLLGLSHRYDRFYLDNQLAYIITKRGKPILIIGFAIATDMRLLVSQIQLVNPKGNRWLFKLPHHYMDYALLKMKEAFSGFDLYLVEGESLANKIKSNYDEKSPMDLKHYQHVIKSYSRPLDLFERIGDKEYIGKYHYYKLEEIDG